MRLTFDGDWHATLTDDPLPVTPRLVGTSMEMAAYTDAEERERFLARTFGSQDWLWDVSDVLRFDPARSVAPEQPQDFRFERHPSVKNLRKSLCWTSVCGR